MGTILLIVVMAAWAAVLLPPLLRSRVENRPNSSVSDFRQQLSSLQSAVPGRGAMRAMGRSLAPSSLGRPPASGRPARSATITPRGQHSYGPHQRGDERAAAPEPSRRGHRQPAASTGRRHGDQARLRRPAAASVADAKRRRTNVLFVLLLTTFCSGFLAATSDSTAMVYLFALGLMALGGYIYLLIAMHQREQGRTVGSVLRAQAEQRATKVRERALDRQAQVRVRAASHVQEPPRRRPVPVADPLIGGPHHDAPAYDDFDDRYADPEPAFGYDYDDGAYGVADDELDETAGIYASYELPQVRHQARPSRLVGEPEPPGSGQSGRISYGRSAPRRPRGAAAPMPRDPRDPFGRERAGRDITRGTPVRDGRHATGQQPVQRKRKAPIGEPFLPSR